jgi:hypothetical protein
MLIEELAESDCRVSIDPLNQVCRAARQYLSTIESKLAGQSTGNATVSPELIDALRFVASETACKMTEVGLELMIPAVGEDLSADLRTMGKAIGRLADFGRTGQLTEGGNP